MVKLVNTTDSKSVGIAKDVSDLSQHKSDIERTILDINRDFRENNFAGVIKEIELRAVETKGILETGSK